MNLIYKICINRIKRGLVLLLLLTLSFLTPTKGQQPGQQPLTSEGKDFWLAFLENFNEGGIVLKVYITSEYNTNGTISIPLQSWTQAFSVSANQGIVIEVPYDLAYSANDEIIEQKGIHIIADHNITVWDINYELESQTERMFYLHVQ